MKDAFFKCTRSIGMYICTVINIHKWVEGIGMVILHRK